MSQIHPPSFWKGFALGFIVAIGVAALLIVP
jgi:hypothetical protein